MLYIQKLTSLLRGISPEVYWMGIVGLFVQLGATLIYTTADTTTQTLNLTVNTLLMLRSLSEAVPTFIRGISGVISDNYINPKYMLMISYGSMIILKIVFFMCMMISYRKPSFLVVTYLTYIYMAAQVIDRVMACLRDAPQAALMLHYIAESNKRYLATGDSARADENTVASLAVRKWIALWGSVIGGILAYCILQLKWISLPTTYAIAIVPIVIGNIILYFGIVKAIKVMDAQQSYNHEVQQPQHTSIKAIIEFCYRHCDMIEIIYLLTATVVAYLFDSSLMKASVFLLFHNLVKITANTLLNTVVRSLMLVFLSAGYTLGVSIAFIVGILLSSPLANFYEHANPFMLLGVLQPNTMYTVVYSIAIVVLMHTGHAYLVPLLAAALQMVHRWVPGYLQTWIISIVLMLVQLKVLFVTNSLSSYICMSVITTITLCTTSGYSFMVVPNQLILLCKFVLMALVNYTTLFYIAFIAQYWNWNVLLGSSVITVLSYIAGLFHIPNAIINNRSLIGRISSSAMLIETVTIVYKNRNEAIILASLFCFISILTCIIPFSTAVPRIAVIMALSAFFTMLANYVLRLDIVRSILKYKHELRSFLYITATICIANIGRFNDGLFYKHGYTNIRAGERLIMTTSEVPLIFTFCYVAMGVFTFLPIIFPVQFRKHRTLIFVVVALALVLANLLLYGSSIYSFIAALVCLSLYTSGSEVIFVSLIKDTIPSVNNLNGTFLGFYYLAVSLSTIVNAVLLGWINNPQNISKLVNISKYINTRMYIWLCGNENVLYHILLSVFAIFPLIALILYLFNIYNVNHNTSNMYYAKTDTNQTTYVHAEEYKPDNDEQTSSK
jgi:hypothetical protein